jgi:hypothetical protein
MSTESSSSKVAAGRAPDNRFKDGAAVSDKRIAIGKIDVSSLQLDDTFDGDGDPYNNTGRHRVKAIRER